MQQKTSRNMYDLFSRHYFIFPCLKAPIFTQPPSFASLPQKRKNHTHLNPPHDVTYTRQIYKQQSTVISTKMEGDLYKHLPDGCHQLKEVHLPDCIELLVEGFSHKNEIWSTENLDKSVFRAFFVNELRDVMNAQARLREYRNDNVVINFIYVIGGKLVCCFCTYEVYEYRRTQATYVPPSDIPLYRELERQGKELAKAVDLEKVERGKHIFAVWTAHANDPSITTQQKLQELAEYFDAMRRQGFLSMVGRSTNTAGVQIMLRLGTEKLREVDFLKNDNVFKLYFLKLDFYNPKFEYVIKKIRDQQRPKEIKAKL